MNAWQTRVAGWGRHIFRDRPPRRPGDVVLMSNDYLALAGHPDLVTARMEALARHGAGTAMAGMFVLDDDPQRWVEDELADLLQSPAALLCQSGWDANVGLVGALLGPLGEGCPVYPDMLAHASLWSGTRGTGAELHPFVHNDVGHLRRLLARYGPGLVCVDTVYGTTGDLAPLADVVEVCEEYQCVLIADESHALGVFGPRGAGVAAGLGLADRVAFRTASLAKAFAGRAGLIAGPSEVADYLPFHSLNALHSSTLLPHDVAGIAAALRLVVTDDVRRKRLWDVTARLREGLLAVGVDVAPSRSPILPLHAGTDENLAEIQGRLDGLGVFGAAFLPPITPRDRALLRLSAHADLTGDEVARIIEACATVAPLIRTGPQPRLRAV